MKLVKSPVAAGVAPPAGEVALELAVVAAVVVAEVEVR